MKPVIYLIALILSFSASTEAAPVTIEYSGHVIRHDQYPENGYEIGDTVSGALRVDKTKARAEYLSPGRSNLSGWGEEYGLVSGYLDKEEGSALDSAVVWNHSWPGYEYDGDDHLSITDGIVFSKRYVSEFFTFSLNVHLGSIDWIPDLNIENINIEVTDPAIIQDSLGIISHMYVIEGDIQNYTVSYTTLFRLDYLKIASVNVSEPISFWLCLIGFMAVLVRRMSFEK